MKCPRCGSDDVALEGSLQKRIYWCHSCHHYFTKLVPSCA